MRDLFKNKNYGFYVTLAAAVLAIVTDIVYSVNYGQSMYMSWVGFVMLLIGVVGTIVLVLLKQTRFAPTAMMFFAFIGTLFFIYYMYFFISSALTGIQYAGLPPQFLATAILFIITLVVSVAAVFMPQEKEN